VEEVEEAMVAAGRSQWLRTQAGDASQVGADAHRGQHDQQPEVGAPAAQAGRRAATVWDHTIQSCIDGGALSSLTYPIAVLCYRT